MNIEWIFFSVAIACLFPPTYFLGAHFERVRWNRLIEDGVLPTPMRLEGK